MVALGGKTVLLYSIYGWQNCAWPWAAKLCGCLRRQNCVTINGRQNCVLDWAAKLAFPLGAKTVPINMAGKYQGD